MEIIPSFDLLDNQLVRLRQGDFEQKTVYPLDPLQLAQELETAGIRRLHITDLEGARSGKIAHHHVLAQLAARTRLKIDFGGGLRSIPSLKQAWDAGASLFSVGSVAVTAPDEFRAWVEKFGPDKFLVSADVRGHFLAVHGWARQTAVGLYDFLDQMFLLGIRQVSVTDIEREGDLGGPATDLYSDLLERYSALLLVASGGIRHRADLETLAGIGCAGAIVGTAFFEGRITLHDFRQFSEKTAP